MAQIKISLDERDGEAGTTWVTVMPIYGATVHDAARAAGEALGMFVAGLVRETEVVERALRADRQSPQPYPIPPDIPSTSDSVLVTNPLRDMTKANLA